MSEPTEARECAECGHAKAVLHASEISASGAVLARWCLACRKLGKVCGGGTGRERDGGEASDFVRILGGDDRLSAPLPAPSDARGEDFGEKWAYDDEQVRAAFKRLRYGLRQETEEREPVAVVGEAVAFYIRHRNALRGIPDPAKLIEAADALYAHRDWRQMPQTVLDAYRTARGTPPRKEKP